MKSVEYSKKKNLETYIDNVVNNQETLIIKRKAGKGAVMISLNEYNSIVETLHLLNSKANADRMRESIEQMKNGESFEKELH